MKDIITATVSHVYHAFNHDYSELADNGFMDFDDLGLPMEDQDEIALDAINDTLSDFDMDGITCLMSILNYYGKYDTSFELFVLYARSLMDSDNAEEVLESVKEIVGSICTC